MIFRDGRWWQPVGDDTMVITSITTARIFVDRGGQWNARLFAGSVKTSASIQSEDVQLFISILRGLRVRAESFMTDQNVLAVIAEIND